MSRLRGLSLAKIPSSGGGAAGASLLYANSGSPELANALPAISTVPPTTDITTVADPTTGLLSKIPLSLLPFVQTPNASNVVIAACVINSFTTGGVVTWSMITGGGHEPVFFTSVEQSPDTPTRIRINFPFVTNIGTFLVAPDESFTGLGVWAGATVANNWADIQMGTFGGVGKVLFQGNGTTWVPIDPTGANQIIPGYTVVGNRLNIVNNAGHGGGTINSWDARYMGSGGYFIKPVYSGLGSFNGAYDLVDNTGSPVTPQTTDFLMFDTGAVTANDINAYDPNNPFVSVAGSNFWVIGVFYL